MKYLISIILFVVFVQYLLSQSETELQNFTDKYQQAWNLVEEKQYSKSLKLFSIIIKNCPKFGELSLIEYLRYDRGMIAFVEGDFNTSINDFNFIIGSKNAVDSIKTASLYNLATVQLLLNKHKEAKATLEYLLSNFKIDLDFQARVFGKRSLLNMYFGLKNNALQDLEMAMKIDPINPRYKQVYEWYKIIPVKEIQKFRKITKEQFKKTNTKEYRENVFLNEAKRTNFLFK